MLPLRFPFLTVLDEADVLGVAAEALPAAHQPVLADQAMRVAADTANPGSGAVVLGVRVPDVRVSHGGGGGAACNWKPYLLLSPG